MKKIIILIGLLIFNAGLTGCQKEKTISEKLIEMGETVNKVLDEFEKARTKMLGVFGEFATNIEKYLTNNPKDIAETANRWESDWRTVADQIKALESKFDEVEKSSKKYFDQLDFLTDNINNSQLRASEAQKNDDLRARWHKVYDQAERDMNNIREVLNEGNDFRNVLLSSAMRAKIDDNIEQMKGISRKAKRILNQLAGFSNNGKRVLRGETPAESSNHTITDQPNKKENTNAQTQNNAMTPIKAVKVKASTFQAGEGLVFKPENVNDDNLETWWSPKNSEDLSNEWLMIEFDQEQTVRAIEIHGGSHNPNFRNLGDIYDKNYRVERGMLEFSDGTDREFSLQDADQVQVVEFAAKKTKYIMLKIRSVYPSSKWKDACISHFVALK